MSKAYKITKRTVMFDKQNPKTVYSVSPVSYGILTTEDAANQIAAESSATPGDVKNVLDRYEYIHLKTDFQCQLRVTVTLEGYSFPYRQRHLVFTCLPPIY